MALQYKIVENESTVTLVVSPVNITGVKYLFNQLEGEKKKYYFAVGTFPDVDLKTEIGKMITELAKSLATVSKLGITPNDLFSSAEEAKTVFKLHRNKDGEWVNKEAQISLINFANQKTFLFEDLKMERPIKENIAWTKTYAIEVEFNAYLKKDTEEKQIFANFHRGIAIKNRDDVNWRENDEAWSGFNFEEKKNEDPFPDAKSNFDIRDEDLPF